jgi:hypothetical protein
LVHIKSKRRVSTFKAAAALNYTTRFQPKDIV